MSKKNSLTPAGIEPATFGIVAQLPRSLIDILYYYERILKKKRKKRKLLNMAGPIEPTGEGDNIYLPARGKRNGKISMQHLGIYTRKILKCF